MSHVAWTSWVQFEWQLPPDIPRRVAGATALVLVAAVVYWWFSAPAETVAVDVVPTVAATTTTGIVVHVIGDVRRPGVVELPPGSRVMDAVEAAGGLRPRTVVTENLARVLVDGEQIVIGAQSQRLAAVDDGRIHLNTATASQIEQLPGVGPVIAERIVEYRESHGSFRQLRDLLNVPGIGDSKYAQIADAATL